MNTPTKQTVYLPAKEENDYGYFFTPEQLNEYTASVIKQALENAAEKAFGNHEFDGAHGCDYEIDKHSITNVFEETFKKFEV